MDGYKMPKCTCGEELGFDKDTDIFCEGDTLIMVSHGHCPKCGKKYKWNNYYYLPRWDSLEEI